MLGLMDYPLVMLPSLRPFSRVLVILTFNGVPSVLMDGIITDQQLVPSNEPGESTFTITGEDVSVMMDLEEKSVEHPAPDRDGDRAQAHRRLRTVRADPGRHPARRARRAAAHRAHARSSKAPTWPYLSLMAPAQRLRLLRHHPARRRSPTPRTGGRRSESACRSARCRSTWAPRRNVDGLTFRNNALATDPGRRTGPGPDRPTRRSRCRRSRALRTPLARSRRWSSNRPNVRTPSCA